MYTNKQAFTFVELMVVLVIIAILSTIGFTLYESYISMGRDTARIMNLQGLHQSFSSYALKNKLPAPQNATRILASGSLISLQGDVTEEIAQKISFKGDVYDDSLELYPVYVLSANKKDFQLLNFVEDSASLQTYIPKTQALEYNILYVKILGKPLGVLLDEETQTPIHRDTTHFPSSLELINYSGNPLSVYYSDTSYFSTQSKPLLEILPDASCKRIQDMGKSKGDGIYTINPKGKGNINVYCDMTTDGGGWTMIARSVTGALNSQFGWTTKTGSTMDDTKAYSYGTGVENIPFREILVGRYTKGKILDYAIAIDINSSNFNLTSNTAYKTNSVRLVRDEGLSSSERTWNHGRMFQYWGYFPRTDTYWFRDGTTASTYGLNKNKLETAGYNSTYGAFDEKQGMIFIR